MKNWRVAMIKVNFDKIFLDSDEARCLTFIQLFIFQCCLNVSAIFILQSSEIL